ncbi:hypothetical protein [Nitrososphaera sp.]|uniref:hypothetical protein n=1 Tax=Nitrososphaera sp. TaxID=1971748 RepID=UPI00307DF28F
MNLAKNFTATAGPINWRRLAIAAPAAAALNMTLLFLLFMNPLSQRIIFDESGAGQSPKLVAVWTEIEPVPSLASLAPALIVTPLIYSFVFALLHPAIPGKSGLHKGVVFGLILWGLIAVFFELFTPSGLFGEPAHLLAYELSLWLAALVAVGAVLGAMYRASEEPQSA